MNPAYPSDVTDAQRAIFVPTATPGGRPRRHPDPSKAAIRAAETVDDEHALRTFVWGIDDVVSALIRHDFQSVALLELSEADMYRGLGDAAQCVPAVYRLMGKRR